LANGRIIAVACTTFCSVLILTLGPYICSLHHAKKLFYSSVNAIFGEILRIASEEVVLQLIISRGIAVILYGLEACPLTESDLLSMDGVINRFLMKLFKASNITNVKYCQECFSFDTPSDLWRKRVTNFESKFTVFCLKVFSSFCLLVLLYIMFAVFHVTATMIR